MSIYSSDVMAALSPQGLAFVAWKRVPAAPGGSSAENTTLTRQYDPKSGWAEAVPIGAGIAIPAAAINDAGKVVRASAAALGIDRDGNGLEVYERSGDTWARRYTGAAWQTPIKLADDVHTPLISVSPDGSAMVVGSTSAGKLWYGFFE